MNVEKCIKDLASDFSKHYKNYRIEEEIRSRLAEYLRGEFKRTDEGNELVRVQFPVWYNPREHFDVVILTKNAAAEFAKHYGKSVKICTRDFNSHSVFELKLKTSINHANDLIRQDIERLKKVIKKEGTKNAYMLLFFQYDLDKSKKGDILKEYSKDASECKNLNIYCFFRNQSDSGKRIFFKVIN